MNRPFLKNTPIYHLDQVVVTIYSSLPTDTCKKLRGLQSFKTLSKSRTGNRTSLALKNPDQYAVDTLLKILAHFQYDISKIELARDTPFIDLYEANRALERYEQAVVRKGISSFRVFESNDANKARNSELIGEKTLYYGSKVKEEADPRQETKRQRTQFVVYVRIFQDRPVLREELRIVHHFLIKKLTGIETLADIPFFNLKSMLDDWIVENLFEAHFRWDKATNVCFSLLEKPTCATLDVMRRLCPTSSPLAEYNRMVREIRERILMQAWGDTAAGARYRIDLFLKRRRDTIEKKRGRRSVLEKRWLKTRTSHFLCRK